MSKEINDCLITVDIEPQLRLGLLETAYIIFRGRCSGTGTFIEELIGEIG